MTNITEYGEILPYTSLDEIGFCKINGIMDDGRIVITISVGPVETISAKDFPMQYKTSTSEELRSKVSGQTTLVSTKDFPTLLVKRGKQNELSSDFAA